MPTATHQIKCAHCKRTHSTVGEVKDCARGITPTPAQVPQSAPVEQKVLLSATGHIGQHGFVTQNQYNYLVDLGADPEAAKWYTFNHASKTITRLKKGRPMGQSVQPKIPIPREFLDGLREGYYASRPDSSRNFSFFRVSRPQRGNYKGCLKIQTQHGPDLKLFLVIYPDGKEYLYNTSSMVMDDLMLVCVDQRGCAMAYAEELGNCMRCNTELTDDRSRWYGIGPECEKHWPEIINEVNDTKGEFKYGNS